jgi:geranylgeranyl reductase family protein
VRNYSHIVIGGGPAGATAAEHLAVSGQKVLVIEKSVAHPFREKPCGGGLGPITTKLFPYTKSQGVHTTSKVAMSLGKDRIEASVPIVMVDRDKFDFYLLERAMRSGAKVFFGATVKSIDTKAKLVVLTNGQRIDYKYLICAGGFTCPSSKMVEGEKKNVPLIVGKADGGKLNASDTAEIIFFEKLNGYAWIFPKGKFLDVGIGGDSPLSLQKELLEKLLRERGLKLYDRAGWGLPFEVDTIEPVIGSGAMLAGDAAGFVNPATGEGIRYAMQSGLEAAEVVLGKRSIEDYPSFLETLCRLEVSRDKIISQGMRKSFDAMKANPELVSETIGFFFEDKEPPERKPMSDEQRLEAYKKISESIPGNNSKGEQ